MEFLTDRTFLKNWAICQLLICQKFMMCAICRNVILRAMTDSTEVKRRAKVCERSDHQATLRPRGRRCFPSFVTFSANHEFLCDLSKIPFGKLPFRKLLCTNFVFLNCLKSTIPHLEIVRWLSLYDSVYRVGFQIFFRSNCSSLQGSPSPILSCLV